MDKDKIYVINNIDFNIVKTKKENNWSNAEHRITIKILLNNKTKFYLSKVYFDIRLYDKNDNLIDVAKEHIYHIRPNNESVGIISFLTDCSNISKYEMKISDVSF